MAFYGKAIAILIAILAVLAFTGIGAIVGRLAMLGTAGLLIWLVCRLVLFGNWKETGYWEVNLGIGAGAIALFAIMAFVMYFNPPTPNLGNTHCTVSRYESC